MTKTQAGFPVGTRVRVTGALWKTGNITGTVVEQPEEYACEDDKPYVYVNEDNSGYQGFPYYPDELEVI
jgi:hypothetical protein